MRYSLYIYATKLDSADSICIPECNEAMMNGRWGDYSPGCHMRPFDTAELTAAVTTALTDRCRIHSHALPEPYADVSYLYLVTTYEHAPSVLPVLHGLCTERDLVLYDAERDKTYYRDLVDMAFIRCKTRAAEIRQRILTEMKPVWTYRSLGGEDSYQRRYVVTLRNDAEKPFYIRCEEFCHCLSSLLEPGEELECAQGFFRICSESYEIVLCLEGYKKQSDMIAWYENGRPRAEKAGRMGCEQAFRWLKDKPGKSKAVFQRMNFREMIEKYPNPADRFVAAVKISKWEQKQDYGISYRGIGPYGAEILFHVVPGDYDDPASYSVLAIDEFDAELLFHFISAYYPYIYQRYYDNNYIPAQMMIDILGKMEEAFETEKRSSLTPKTAGLLRAFIQWAELQLELYYDCDDNVVFNVQGP